jgi:hypothetical protein
MKFWKFRSASSYAVQRIACPLPGAIYNIANPVFDRRMDLLNSSYQKQRFDSDTDRCAKFSDDTRHRRERRYRRHAVHQPLPLRQASQEGFVAEPLASNERVRPCGELDPWLPLILQSQGFSRNTDYVSDTRLTLDLRTQTRRYIHPDAFWLLVGCLAPFPFSALQDARTLQKTWFDWPSMRGLSRAAGPPCLVLHSSALYCRLSDSTLELGPELPR